MSMDYLEAMAALQEFVEHRVLLTCYRPDGTQSNQHEGQFAIGGSDPTDFGAEHLPEHQLDITVSNPNEELGPISFWGLTESEHSDGEWLEHEGHRVLELRCTDGTAARLKLLD